MSIKPWEKYQPNAQIPTQQYPWGSLKNESNLGIGDGTPLDVDWGNDFEAFKQTAFDRSGLAPSGIADTVENSEMFNAMQDIVLRNVWKRLVLEVGYTLLPGSFEDGAVLNSSTQCLWYKTENKVYLWKGTIPSGGKTVPMDSSPSTSGGVSPSGDWADIGDASVYSRVFSALSSENGTSLIGHKGRSNEKKITVKDDMNSGMVNVFRYLNEAERAAVMSGNYGPIATLSPAIDAAIADIGSGAYPVNAKGLWFPNGAWIIDKPVRSKIPLKIDGDAARLIASPAFVGSTLNNGGTPIVVDAMMVFVPDDNYNTINGPQAQGMSVGRGITLHGGDVVDAGVYTERMVYASYNMRVDYAATPVIVGPYSWGLNLDDIILENFDTHGIHFKTNSAANGCSISTPRIWGRFKNPISALFFDANAECNGVHVSGGFLEKVGYAGLHAPGSGTCHYDAVDMEQCANTAVRVVGNNPNSVPVVISGGCFLDSPVIRVSVDNAAVEIRGSRLYGQNGGLDFSTTNTGKVVATNNEYHQGMYTFAPGSRVVYEDAVSVNDDRVAILPSNTAAVTNVANNAHRNNAASPNLNTTNISRLHSQLTTANSESAIDIYASAITGGVESRIAGLRCSTLNGVNAVHPFLDNTTAIGLPSARCSVVYSAAGVQTTSDSRHKEQVLAVSEAERAVAAELKGMIKSFRLIGSDKTAFGIIAQEVCSVFERNGIDWRDYDVVHYDEWEGGNIYGVKYDQLLALIISAM